MDQLGPLAVFAIVATISPGGATALATASGVRFGVLRSLPLLAGISAGLGVLMVVVGAGLGTVVQQYPSAQFYLKVVGSAYLLWLAWSIARQGAPRGESALEKPMGFATGVLLLWLNPKAWTMATAAAGTYASLADSGLALGLLLGVVFLLAAAGSTFTWCVLGSALARWLHTERAWRGVNVSLAVLLAASIVPLWM
ncbi:MAG: LysE family translocator [Pseudomonadota bacterium]